MKFKINFPKIEIIHSYVEKPYKKSFISEILDSIKDFLDDMEDLRWPLILLTITIGLFIYTWQTAPTKHLYECKIISVECPSKGSPNGYFEFNGYRFNKDISDSEYTYITKNNLKTLKINTSEDVVKRETTANDIFSIIFIILCGITVIRFIIFLTEL